MRENSIDSEYPLVSIVVVTYNSQSFIKETLDSIRNQSYAQLELIISDDKSSDSTIEICSQWLADYKSRFVKSKLLTSNENTGTSANLNRGIKASSGLWIKSIAGDDTLTMDCIKIFMDYAKEGKFDFYVCKLNPFNNNLGLSVDLIDTYEIFHKKAKEPFEIKRKRIIHENIFPGPAYFYSRHLYNQVGGYDERYKLMEEWPFIYNILLSGYDIRAIDDVLVNYRISNSSVCHSGKNVNYQFFLDNMSYFRDVILNELLKEKLYAEAIKKTWYYISRYLKYNFYHKVNSVR